MIRVMVTGSRHWRDRRTVYVALRDVALLFEGRPNPAGGVYAIDEPITVIHGAGRGADTVADEAAKALGYPVEPFPADWEEKPGYAGLERNVAMAETIPDICLAFRLVGVQCTGTNHAMGQCQKRGIKVVLYDFPAPREKRLDDIPAPVI